MDMISRATLVGRALEEASLQAPDHRAAIFGEETISFRALDENSDRLAAGFIGLGLGKGDRVAILAPNCPEWLTVYFAAAKIGAICVGLSTRPATPALADLLNRSRPRLVV